MQPSIANCGVLLLQAVFNVSVTIPTGMAALSNMPQASAFESQMHTRSGSCHTWLHTVYTGPGGVHLLSFAQA